MYYCPLVVVISRDREGVDVFRCRYGFRTPPHLELKARPKLGEREVTLAHVTDWIEKKLEQEFQVLIFPCSSGTAEELRLLLFRLLASVNTVL